MAAFHQRCPFAADPAAAAFVLPVFDPPPLAALAQGTDEEPHLSATLLPVLALAEGTGWRLSGPASLARRGRCPRRAAGFAMPSPPSAAASRAGWT